MDMAAKVEHVGRILAEVREHSGIKQAALAKSTGINPTRLFRIEAGEALPTNEEITTYLRGVGTQLADDCLQYLSAEWVDATWQPAFPHPNWRELHIINEQLDRIATLKADRETKAVFVRALELYESELIRCAKFLQRLDHLLVLVGIISVGKTSAIASALGLMLNDSSLPFARRVVLEVGSGRVTLCEVRVRPGPQYGLVIEPMSDEEVRRIVLDYADHLLAMSRRPSSKKETDTGKPGGSAAIGDEKRGEKTAASLEEIPWVPEEMARAIRGLANLTEAAAADLPMTFVSREELAIEILGRMDLLRRRETTIWCPEGSDAEQQLAWLQKVFKDINNGRRTGVTLPKRITITMPTPLFPETGLDLGAVDTKGIDQTLTRADIDAHIDDPHAVVFLCTKFGEAPDLATMNLIKRARSIYGDTRLAGRLVVLVLPRDDEALNMKDEVKNDFVESVAAGYQIKLTHVRRALQPLGAESLPIQFLNAKSADDLLRFRTFVVKHFHELRQQYATRVSTAVSKLNELVANRTKEERELVFKDVMHRLSVWATSNERLDANVRPDNVLIEDIQGTHPRTIWASVRREGRWDNFDYFYHLGSGARQIVSGLASERLKKLTVLIENLSADPACTDASEFLRQISEHVEIAAEKLERQVQIAGETYYRERLKTASAYWSECESSYGTGGPYRFVVARKTEDLFNAKDIQDLHRRLGEDVDRGWQAFINDLKALLKAPSDPETDAD